MSEEEINIAIAEACGWTTKHKGLWVERLQTYAALPDYLNDLNAMHDAEKVLPRPLYHVDYWQKGYGRFQQILSGLTITPYSATASQRAEAFVRTIGKWKE